MGKLRKCIEEPSRFLEDISCILLVIVCAVSLVNVLIRLIMGTPIYGALEIVQYGVLAAMCLALPSSTFYGSHARVEFVTEKLQFLGKKLFRVSTDFVSALLFIFIIYSMIGPMLDIMERGRTTDVFHIPYYWVHLIIIVGLALKVVVLLYQVFQYLILNRTQFEQLENEQVIEDIKREANLDLTQIEGDAEEATGKTSTGGGE
jgi:TRAP-type C4-dicarboxylate transport system permease small subunit